MKSDGKKVTSLNDLAVMVANGFEHTATKQDVAGLSGRVDKLENGMEKVETRLEKVEHKMEALNSNVGNYLDLSEKRYIELKRRDVLLAKWLKLIADKTGTPIDLSQLEKF